jgi:hypothetical protein
VPAIKAAYQGIVLELLYMGYVGFLGLPLARNTASGGVGGGDR